MEKIGKDFKFSPDPVFQALCGEYVKTMFGENWWDVVEAKMNPGGGTVKCRSSRWAFEWISTSSHTIKCWRGSSLHDPSDALPADFTLSNTGSRALIHYRAGNRRDQPNGFPAQILYSAAGNPLKAEFASGKRYEGEELEKIIAGIRAKAVATLCSDDQQIFTLKKSSPSFASISGKEVVGK